MGTCCASRTDMEGKTKTGKTVGNKSGTPGGGVATAGGKSTKAGVVFNPMDEIRDTVM